MGTLSKEIQERKQGISGVLKSLKSVITVVNKASRLCKRLLARKASLPDEKDLIDILSLIREVIASVGNLSKLPTDLSNIFRL